MPVVQSDDLSSFLRSNAGQHLRTVAQYDATDHQIHYLREDVAAKYEGADITELFDVLRDDQRRVGSQTEALQMGAHGCTVEVYEQGIILNFSQGPSVGTMVSLDASAGSDLLSFIVRCRQFLEN